MIEQVARTIAGAITRVSAVGGSVGETAGSEGPNAAGDVIIRSESAARLKPFTPSAPCAVFTVKLDSGDGAVWTGVLAMTSERLDSLLPGLGAPVAANDDDAAKRIADIAAFGPMPLPLQAVLAEFELSLGQLDRLAPGDEIPIAIARDIPVRLGAQLVASGSLGTMEDRMAVKVTSVPAAPISAAVTSTEGQPK